VERRQSSWSRQEKIVLLILTLLNALLGIYIWNSGNRYEGEWKDDKRHGQGKKRYFY